MEDLFLKVNNWITEKYTLSRLVTLLLTLTLILIVFFTFFGKPKANQAKEEKLIPKFEKVDQTRTESLDSKTIESQGEANEIVVDVKGAVMHEGVYHLKAGSRVTDLVQMAGGLSPEADRNALNLAEKLSDASMIYVAKKGEINSSELVLKAAASSSDKQDEKININKASEADLTKIPGVGQKRAQEIIAERDRQGGVKSIDDLLKISGIGQKTLDKLKNDITVD
ncbi:competence protein ComEA [Streptococcus iniae]|uniref:ComEA family DNA-binding protein n=1 Tax=Streptococcus iniae TaxID=1346 RepID=UPI0008DACF50|nr:ComEA family DNA-binding protein [Streptococcus iniae]OHX26542.1 competence protein ComEA [Streptococcus iniae]RLV28196.1 competence protein ComEA [Streptococcus iniae]